MGYPRGFINEDQGISYGRQRLNGMPELNKEINCDTIFSPCTSDRGEFTCI
jgi:hypothetical protein